MQQAKDSFYMALRERLAEASPERTVVVDGVERPAIVVAENETSEQVMTAEDVFRITWGQCTRVGGGSGLMKMDCTVNYATRGTDGTSGDRGRAISDLDAELMSIAQPPRTLQMDYATIPAKSAGTMVFWTDLEFGAPEDEAGRVAREAKTTVYFFAPVNGAEVQA